MVRLIAISGAVLFLINFIIKQPVVIYIAAAFLSCDLFINTYRNIKNKIYLNENLSLIIVCIITLIMKNYNEAILILLMYQIGNFLISLYIDKSKKNIVKQFDFKNEIIHLKNGDESPQNVKAGDIIYIRALEKIPFDGIVKKGNAELDVKNLTGEDKLIKVKENDRVISGSINMDGYLQVEVTKSLEESSATKIMKMIKEASNTKTNSEKFITKFSKIYTSIVVLIAFLLTIIPALLKQPIDFWLHKSLTFLILSCPCSLVISISLSYFLAIGKCSKMGVLINGAIHLETLSNVKTVALDKTGTITKGEFEINKIIPYQTNSEELLSYTAYAEYNSNHPIALAIKKKYNKKINNKYIEDYEEISGMGVKAIIDGSLILIGNYKLFDRYNINYPKVEFLGTTLLVSKDNEYIGTIVISDTVKDECIDIVSELKKGGFKRVIMLSGDDDDIVKKLGAKLNFDEAYGSLLPNEKANIVKELVKKDETIFIGDGIKDVMSLFNASTSASMCTIGSDVATLSSNIAIMDGNLLKIIDAYDIARKTKNIVKFNILIALMFKFMCLILGLFMNLNMLIVVLAEMGVTLFLVFNTIRKYQ